MGNVRGSAAAKQEQALTGPDQTILSFFYKTPSFYCYNLYMIKDNSLKFAGLISIGYLVIQVLSNDIDGLDIIPALVLGAIVYVLMKKLEHTRR